MLIHETAFVSRGAQLEADVEVGAFTIVYDNVQVAEGTRIASHCVIGEPSPLANGAPLVIGKDSLIRSHSVLYEGSSFGERLQTGHRVTIRENSSVGINLRVGTLSDIQGDLVIGDYVRLHSNVFISKQAHLGNFVWIFPYTVLTNDLTPPSANHYHRGVVVGDYAVIAASCCIGPGVRIGEGSLVGAMSMVTRDVDPHMAVRGSPARLFGPASAIKLPDESGKAAYPWTTHYRSGYPDAVIEQWDLATDD